MRHVCHFTVGWRVNELDVNSKTSASPHHQLAQAECGRRSLINRVSTASQVRRVTLFSTRLAFTSILAAHWT
jgi:hypothetical protein